SFHRQLAFADGGRLGPPVAGMVFAPAPAIQNADQLNHVVGAITLVIAISSQIGAGLQEAFQLVDNAANVFYGIVYTVMFAIPIAGAAAIRAGARTWLRLSAGAGLTVCLLAIFFTIYPIIDVPSPLIFAAKVIAVTLVANLIGITIFALNYKRRGAI